MTHTTEATPTPTRTAPPVGALRRGRAGVISALVGVLAGLLMMVGAGSANAATLTPGYFNASLSSAWTWGDCFIEVGPVVDYYSPWAAIAGATANCSGRHSSTTVTVALKFNGATVVGSSRTYNFGNSFGTGSRIVTTPRYCGAGTWQETATITISGLGALTFPSNPAWQATGCVA